MLDGSCVHMLISSSIVRQIQMLSRNSLLSLYSTQARCILNRLKITQKAPAMKQMTMQKAQERPTTRFRGRARSIGLKRTLSSHIFFMKRSVQVSYYWKALALTAEESKGSPMCWLDSASLYLGPTLSPDYSQLGGERSIFFLMRRMVRKTQTMSTMRNYMKTMMRWEFWSTVKAIPLLLIYYIRANTNHHRFGLKQARKRGQKDKDNDLATKIMKMLMRSLWFGLYVQHRIRVQPQILKGLLLTELVVSSREVAHYFERSSGDSPHPEVDILDVAFLRQQQDVDLPLLVADLQLAYALLFDLLALDHKVLFSLEEQALLAVADNCLIFFPLLLPLPVCLSVQPFFYFTADVEHLTILNDLLGQLAEELFLGGRLEVPVFFGLEGIDGLIRALIRILLADPIDDLQEDSIREFGLKDVGEVAVDQVAEDLKGFFGVVGEELVAFDGDAVGEETHGQAFSLSELVHPVLLVDLSAQALRMQAGVELLRPSLNSTDVYLTRQAILVVRLRDVLLHFVSLQLPFYLIAHPFQPVLLEVRLHLFYLFLQFSVLALDALHFLVLLAGVVPVPLQEGILSSQFLQLLRFLLGNAIVTLSSSLWFLHVISTFLRRAAMVVSRSFSDCVLLLLAFCLGGSFSVLSSLQVAFFSTLVEGTGGESSDAKSFSIFLESQSSKRSVLGSQMMFLPAFTRELFFIFSRYLDLELACREGGFLSQLSQILKSPFRKKLIGLLFIIATNASSLR